MKYPETENRLILAVSVVMFYLCVSGGGVYSTPIGSQNPGVQRLCAGLLFVFKPCASCPQRKFQSSVAKTTE